MQYNYLTFLSKLSLMVAPSGHEDEVIRLWEETISPYVDEITSDVMGNVIAVKKGKQGGKKVMLTAHADEIGLVVKYVDNDGFLYFDEIGGVDVSLLPGRKVVLKGLNEDVIGVIGVRPIHLQQERNKSNEVLSQDLWIDIGAKDRMEALSKVDIGCVATILSDIHISDGRISGKAMDNRCSLAVLVELARRLYDYQTEYDICYVATVQEELRGRGAQTVAYALNPDACIVLDVAHATDYPSMSFIRDGEIKLGGGAVVTLGPNIDRRIVRKLRTVADCNGLKCQIEIAARPTGTDANPIQTTRAGIPTALVGIPCRYMHSPVETVDCYDLEAVCLLLEKFIKSFDILCLTN